MIFISLVFLTVCSYEELLYESGEEEGEEEKTGKKVMSTRHIIVLICCAAEMLQFVSEMTLNSSPGTCMYVTVQ